MERTWLEIWGERSFIVEVPVNFAGALMIANVLPTIDGGRIYIADVPLAFAGWWLFLEAQSVNRWVTNV